MLRIVFTISPWRTICVSRHRLISRLASRLASRPSPPTLNNTSHALLAVSPVGIQKRPAQADCLGSQRKRLDHVSTRAHAAVNHNVDLVEQVWPEYPYLVEHIDGRRRIVGLAAAVVRLESRSVTLCHVMSCFRSKQGPAYQENAIYTVVHAQLDILHRLDTLDDYGQLGVFLDVVLAADSVPLLMISVTCSPPPLTLMKPISFHVRLRSW